jgi:hypothetical protein
MPKSHNSREKLNKDGLYDGPPYSSRETGQKSLLLRFKCFAMFKEKSSKFLNFTDWAFMTFVWNLNTLGFHEKQECSLRQLKVKYRNLMSKNRHISQRCHLRNFSQCH